MSIYACVPCLRAALCSRVCVCERACLSVVYDAHYGAFTAERTAAVAAIT